MFLLAWLLSVHLLMASPMYHGTQSTIQSGISQPGPAGDPDYPTGNPGGLKPATK